MGEVCDSLPLGQLNALLPLLERFLDTLSIAVNYYRLSYYGMVVSEEEPLNDNYYSKRTALVQNLRHLMAIIVKLRPLSGLFLLQNLEPATSQEQQASKINIGVLVVIQEYRGP